MEKLIYAADDEPDILDVLREFLTNAGYNVKTFATGDELLSCFKEEPSDLAVLDIMMPGTDGLTICKELRKISDIPIVILTAKESESDQMRGYMFGGDDYLVKPFSPSLLVMKIKALLRRTGTEDTEAVDRPFGDIILSPSVHDVLCKGNTVGLSMTEYALIEMTLLAVTAHHYAHAVNLGQLDPVEVVEVRDGLGAWCSAANVPRASAKPPSLGNFG